MIDEWVGAFEFAILHQCTNIYWRMKYVLHAYVLQNFPARKSDSIRNLLLQA